MSANHLSDAGRGSNPNRLDFVDLVKKYPNRKFLLVEPEYKQVFPSIGLLKISTFLKQQGHTVRYVRGTKAIEGEFDNVLMTTMFSFDWDICLNTFFHYYERFQNSRFFIGGVYASLFPDHVEKCTGIKPTIGSIPEVDECGLDYSLIPLKDDDGACHIFTTKGCPNRCSFCGVPALEGEPRIINSWKNHIRDGAKFVYIHDNNIIALGDEHFSSVIRHMKDLNCKYIFDNGFDCRLFNEHHANLLKDSRISEIRFAFDSKNQDGHIQRAIRHCIDSGIRPSKIKVFILYNYKDDLEDALYRATEVANLGAQPWAMRYKPLKWLNPGRIYVSPKWSKEDVVVFNHYVNRFGVIRRYTYSDYKSARLKPKHKKTFRLPISDKKIQKFVSMDEESVFSNHAFVSNFFSKQNENNDD